jgi:uncharacterized protein YacL
MGFFYNLCFSLGLAWIGYRLSFSYLDLPTWGDLGPARDLVHMLYRLAFSALGFLVGFIVAGVLFRQVVALGSGLRRVPAQDKAAGVFGIIIGLTLTALLSVLFYYTRMPYAALVVVLLAIPCIYLGGTIAMSMKEELFYFFPRLGGTRGEAEPLQPPPRSKLLDTNVIIDGRIADICRTGFVEGPVYVPGFVLEELHLIADSPDALKRNRGRRGLDILNQMQAELKMLVQVFDDYGIALEPAEGVDPKLVKLARHLDASIITNDFNLNKVAQLQGVKVLNINELANAVKPVVLPGEEMIVTIVKEGREPMQGVAYLDDGTMVVVQQGRDYIGQTLRVIVTSVIQTLAGRMIFADVRALVRPEEESADKDVRDHPGGGDRRKTRAVDR